MEKKYKGPKLTVNNLGQIWEGTVEFGDFTMIVGAQASGKSIFLQMLKLLIDRHQIFETLELHAYDWGSKGDRLLDMYFGESMSHIWKEETKAQWDDKSYTTLKSIASRKGPSQKEEKVFYIPAQRVLCVAQGFPRPFSSFEIGDPWIG